MGVEAVVFDIGNVLVEWDPYRPFDRLIGREARDALFEVVPFMEMNDRVDLGENFHSAVEGLAEQHPDHREQVLIWRDHWGEMFAPDLKLSAKCLRALRAKGVPVYALSNFGVETFAIGEEMYPVLKEFDQRFVSGHLKMMKPDPAIYIALEEGTGHAPETLFFIDDKPENIAACEARGWQGHLMQDEQGLVDRLMAEGLLEPGDLK